jgi:hypothetical protein
MHIQRSRTVFGLIVLLLLSACSGPNQGAFHAVIDGVDFNAVPKKFTVTLAPSGSVVFQINASRLIVDDGPPAPGEIGTAQFIISVTDDVVPGIVGTYDGTDGIAEITLDNADVWSTDYPGGSFSLEITQFDLNDNQASGNFTFLAKKAAGDPAVMHVSDGAFLLIGIKDDRP